MGTTDPFGDDVYQPDADDQREDTGLLDSEDTLDDERPDQPYEEGYSPPEKPLGVNRVGVTANEQRQGESLDRRLSEEQPDIRPEPGDGIGDQQGTDGEPIDQEVGDRRSGRLTATDDPERDVFAQDVGIDGAGASAEEAAVHTVDEDADWT
jgi:hypothetical protein